MKIYISGAISSIPLSEALKIFGEAENMLKSKGYEVVNPLTHNHNHKCSWSDYIIEDIRLLTNTNCNAIYMLSNWHKSPGAQIELKIAEAINLKVIFEEPMPPYKYITCNQHNNPESEPRIILISSNLKVTTI